MTKFHFLVIILGCALFFWDISFGVGWLFGWIFAGLLRQFREPVLERLIDFENFSRRKYVGYLLLVMAWIALPLLISFFVPAYINPFAVFAAFFADRILMFVLNMLSKEE